MTYYRNKEIGPVRLKADDSPVTAADRASHEAIIGILQELRPGIPVLSEESRRVPYSERGGWTRYWLVDPLDGTKGFLRRTGEFTVNIALMERGVPGLGVVYAPVLSQLYVGERGSGAFRFEDTGRRVRLSTVATNFDRLRIVASRHHAGPVVQKLLEQLPGVEAVSMDGALKFCLIAEGRADLYYRDRPTMEWDTAAGQCILEEAGGVVRTAEGDTLTYNKVELVNPPFVAAGDSSIDWASRIRRILEDRDWMDA